MDTIICGDCLEVMTGMASGSIDLAVTSAPFNLLASTGGGMRGTSRHSKWANAAIRNGYANYHDCLPHEDYVSWQRDCLTEMMRLLKDDGAIFYHHKRRVQGGLLQDRQDIASGFPVRQIIIWKRSGGINFNSGYFLPTHELIYLIAKPQFKLVPKANAVGDVWDFCQETKNTHPAPFPEPLVHRIISSTAARVVLDPFCGSGTTAVVAKALGRRYIGIDISAEYCAEARDRILRNENGFTTG